MCVCGDVCVCVCVCVKPEPPQGVALRMSGDAPLPFDPNVCVCVCVKPEPPQGVTLRMSAVSGDAPLPFDPNAGSLDEKTAFPLDRLSPSTLETTLGQMAPAKSGRIHECHLIQVAL